MVIRAAIGFLCSGIALLASTALSNPAPLQSASSTASGAAEDIVVVGRPPRCRPRAGDPQDAADLSGARSGLRQTIKFDPGTGHYALVKDSYPVTGPDIWQRAAEHMDNFVFRTPANGGAVCIGERSRFSSGEAQLRRAFAAKPYWGKYMVLSAFVATRNAGRVDMWIAAGANDPRPRNERDVSRDIVAGGPKHVPLTGNYKWQQVNFLIGPIPCMAAQISYGVQLQGGGDVWLAKPSFVEVPEDKFSPSMKRIPHGAEMLSSDPICRHLLKKDLLFARKGQAVVPLAFDADLYPGLVLYREPGGQPIPYNDAFPLGLIEF